MPPRTEIRGQVRYPKGPAVEQGILVTLESAGAGFVAQAQTEPQGKFGFSQIPQGVYVVIVRQPGYREVAQRIDLTMTPTAYVVIDLQPLPGEKRPAIAPKGTGSETSVLQLSIPQGAASEFGKGQELLLQKKEPAASIAHFRKAIQLYPGYTQAYVLWGTAAMNLKKWKDAQAALENALALDHGLAPAYLALGACYNQQGNYVPAEKALVRGLELNPEAAEGHYELGRAYWALGRWQDAEPHARQADALEPGFPPVHVLLGNIMLRKRDASAALREFHEYLRLEPNGPMAPPTRDMVSKIEKALAPSR